MNDFKFQNNFPLFDPQAFKNAFFKSSDTWETFPDAEIFTPYLPGMFLEGAWPYLKAYGIQSFAQGDGYMQFDFMSLVAAYGEIVYVNEPGTAGSSITFDINTATPDGLRWAVNGWSGSPKTVFVDGVQQTHANQFRVSQQGYYFLLPKGSTIDLTGDAEVTLTGKKAFYVFGKWFEGSDASEGCWLAVYDAKYRYGNFSFGAGITLNEINSLVSLLVDPQTYQVVISGRQSLTVNPVDNQFYTVPATAPHLASCFIPVGQPLPGVTDAFDIPYWYSKTALCYSGVSLVQRGSTVDLSGEFIEVNQT